MAESNCRVGWIGLGRMGAAMAQRVLRAGFPLAVYNRTRAKMQPLLDAGAVAAASPAEAAAGARIVVTSLMDDQSVLDATTGAEGLLRGLPQEAVHIGTTTVSPRCAENLATAHAGHGSGYLAAPVVGRPQTAEAGELVSFVAGDAGAVERAHAVVSAYSRMVIPVGSTPALANSLKLAVNYMVATVADLMGQVYAFGEKSGIDPQYLRMVMQTMFGHPGLQEYASRIHERRFDDVGFDLTGGLKDVGLILQASADARAPLPFAGLMRDKMLTALARGLAAKDCSAVYEVTRLHAGLPEE